MKKLLLVTLIACAISASFAQVPVNGLVSYYPFNGNANDSVGNNDGTVFGASLTTNRFGNANAAYNFDGVNDYIGLPASVFDFSNYTYSLWLNMPSLPGSGTRTVLFSTGGSGGDQGISMNNNYNGGVVIFNGVGSYGYYAGPVSGYTNGPALNTNAWYHVVSVRDSNYLKLYVNGALVYTSLSTSGALPIYGTSSFATAIGARFNQTLPFNGKLDDIRIYNRALDSTEVNALYQENFCFQTIYDTVAVFDTTHVTVYDTTYVTVYDTAFVSISVTDTLVINLPNGINHLMSEVKIYPNPTSSEITFDSGDLAGQYQFVLKNTAGQVVFLSDILTRLNTLNVSTFPRGLYIVEIRDDMGNAVATKKIVLQ